MASIVLNCLVFVCASIFLTGIVHGSECYDSVKEDYYSCPTVNDDNDEFYCCGPFEKQRCCDYEEHSRDGTALTKGIVTIIGLIFFMVIILSIIICCCCCCQCCLLYKYRERRRATMVTMTPMQPAAPIRSTDDSGRPLYPVQPQYYPVVAQGYPQQGQYPGGENIPLTGQPNVGTYPTKQLGDVAAEHQAPFTYGAPPKAVHEEYK